MIENINMLHRDLKSANLLITNEWTLKVAGKLKKKIQK